MTSPLSVVTYGSISSPKFQTVADSTLDFDATISRLKQAIQEQDLWLIHEIDPQMLLKRGGYEIRATRQLLFFHPRYMVRLLKLDPNALVEAPLKLVVMQMEDGTVTVRFQNLDVLFGRYGGFTEFIDELTAICDRIVRTVATK